MKNKTLGFLCGVVFTFICLTAILAPLGLVAANQQIGTLTAEAREMELQIIEQAETITAQQELIQAYREQAEATSSVLGQASKALEAIAYGPYTREEIKAMVVEVARIIEKVNSTLAPEEVDEMAQLIVTNAVAAEVDPLLLAAIAITESHFRPEARGAAGEYGMFQVMPGTGRWIAGRLGYSDWSPEEPWDIQTNVQFAAYYLRISIAEFGGDVQRGVLAYNRGSRGAREWLAGNDVNSHRYVRRVMGTYKSLKGV